MDFVQIELARFSNVFGALNQAYFGNKICFLTKINKSEGVFISFLRRVLPIPDKSEERVPLGFMRDKQVNKMLNMRSVMICQGEVNYSETIFSSLTLHFFRFLRFGVLIEIF